VLTHAFFVHDQGARAQRIEYYLLHTFHSKKFILPDKISQRMKEIKSSKRRMDYAPEDRNVDELDADLTLENDPSKGSKTKKGPAYAGGLVLEPKRGLYDKYVLLLDFNSLYPSIIQVSRLFLFLKPLVDVSACLVVNSHDIFRNTISVLRLYHDQKMEFLVYLRVRHLEFFQRYSHHYTSLHFTVTIFNSVYIFYML